MCFAVVLDVLLELGVAIPARAFLLVKIGVHQKDVGITLPKTMHDSRHHAINLLLAGIHLGRSLGRLQEFLQLGVLHEEQLLITQLRDVGKFLVPRHGLLA